MSLTNYDDSSSNNDDDNVKEIDDDSYINNDNNNNNNDNDNDNIINNNNSNNNNTNNNNNNNNNNNKKGHRSRNSVNNMDNILTDAFMNHKRKISQMEQLERQFGAIYDENEAKKMAIETVQRIDNDPYNLFNNDTTMNKVLSKLHRDDTERETHLETAWDNDKLNMDNSLKNAYLNHKRRNSQYQSLLTDFKLLYNENEAHKYAIEVMDQMDRDPYSLFEDDNLMEKVLTKKYMDEIVIQKSKIVSDNKLKNIMKVY